jgi:alcohol dehydrogenase (cytochrome c)
MPAALLAGALLVASSAAAQGEDEGRRQYERLCASCHGADGNGGERGPAIAARLFTRGDDALLASRARRPSRRGHARLRASPIPEARALLAFLRTLRPRRGAPPERVSLETTDRRALGGIVLNRTPADMQVLSDDRRLHLLRREGERWRRVTSQADWPSYHGRLDGNRWSALVQIDKTNLKRLAPRFSYSLGGGGACR